jgi:hypothetical protein
MVDVTADADRVIGLILVVMQVFEISSGHITTAI